MPDLTKPNLNTRCIPFEKCHNDGNCERADLLRFFNIHVLQNFKKLKGDSLESLIKNFRKKTKNEKFQWQSHYAEKSEKRDPLGFFNIRSVARYQTKRRETLWKHLKNSKKN